MAYTDSFRAQHKELAELVRQIVPLLSPGTLAAQADEARRLLSALAGKLTIHLAMEDKSLYPQMIASHSEEARRAAQAFMAEMGALAATFREYTQKWPSADVIKADPDGFCVQTQGIFKALADRVQREESQLYALADKI